ncbi:MAG: thiolase family protein [Candidatus Jordarchaeales archaeon]|nr:thiolase family protein [Candidatus Jordarchaeia archaeon]
MTRRVAVVGYGCLKIGKYGADVSENEMAVKAIKLALEDAGISKEDVEGLVTTPNYLLTLGLQLSVISEYLRVSPRVAAEVACGGVAGGLALKHALNEIMLGYVDVVVCYGSVKESIRFKNIAIVEPGMGLEIYDPVAQPYAVAGVIWSYACSGRRYMYEYGATEEHFAAACVRNRNNAMHNPWAAFTTPITVDDVLSSPVLCSPLKLLDCSAARDGAAAIVLASEEKAKKITDTPIYIAGVGEHHDNSSFIPTDSCDKPITTFVAAKEAAQRALKMAKISVDEVDVAELYAPFSPQELMLPEDIGWFRKGEMVRAIMDGSTEIGGKIPINTDGGILSRGHPAMVTPLYETISIVRQLRGEAGRVQVDGAEIGLMHCEGGMLNNCMVFIFRRGD